MRNFKRAAAMFIALTVFMFSGCIEKKDNRDIGVMEQKQTDLVYSIGELSSDLSKLDEGPDSLRNFSMALFQGLVCEDDKGSINYVLAEKCDISSDGLVYTFTLKDNIKWSNGDEITAYDFCSFFEKLLELNYNSVYRNELKCICGVDEYIKGGVSFSKVAITASQRNIFQIRLNYPKTSFLQMLSQPIYSLRKIDDNLSDWKKNCKNIVCSGAYKITKISANEKVTLEKNEYYVLKENVKSDKLILDLSKKSSEFLLADFETLNNINCFLNPPVTEVERLIKDKEAEAVSSFSVKAVFFNFKSSTAVSDVNFRKAISLILNKNRIDDKNISYYGENSASYFPDGSNFNLAQDIDKNMQGNAYEILKNSKYNSGDVIKIAYIEEGTNKKLCESISKIINDELRQNTGSNKALNINFELDGYSRDEMYAVMKSGSYDMYVGEYNINYDDPMAFLELWDSDFPYNYCSYSSINYDSLLYSCDILKDKNIQNEMYGKCIEQINKDVPVIPLYTKSNVICHKTYVSGIKLDRHGNVLFDSLTVALSHLTIDRGQLTMKDDFPPLLCGKSLT